MKAVLQRVLSSRVEVDGKIVGEIERGWLVLLGIGIGDTKEIARYVADRCVKLRGFSDEQGKMNLSVQEVNGSMLIVSQFTLLADCVRGRRPSFDAAAPPAIASGLGSFLLNMIGVEFALLMWVDNWGPAVGAVIRLGFAALGVVMMVVPRFINRGK